MINLKPKNREKLEKWLIDRMFEWLENFDYCYNIIVDGFVGIHNFTDEQLLNEFKEYHDR